MCARDHHERHYPLIEELRDDLASSYVRMMHALNSDIATELRRARGLMKGPGLYIIQGGLDRLGGLEPPDLSKGVAAPKVKAPKAPKAPKVKSPSEKGKIKQPGIRGGKWYRDEHGNVRYGTKPTKKFTHALTEEESKKLHENLAVSIREITGTKLEKLAEVMEVDLEVFDSVESCADDALRQGRRIEDVYVEYLMEDGYTEEEAHEFFNDLMENYKEALNSKEFKDAARASIKKQERDAVMAIKSAKAQKSVIKNHFDNLMSGDLETVGIQQLAVLYDLGMFHLPETLQQAKKIAEGDLDLARKIQGTARLNLDRSNALVTFADELDPVQQIGIFSMIHLSDEQQALDEDPLLDREDFWQGLVEDPMFDRLRELFVDQGKEYSDAEWDHVKGRIHEVSRNIADMMHAYNQRKGGEVFKALFHKHTSMKKLLTKKGEVDRLKEIQGEIQTRIKLAEEAQKNTDYDIDPAVIKGMKNTIGKEADYFGFQKAAVGWMHAIKRGILAYDAGLGKTPISIAFISDLINKGKAKRGVMVLPPSLMAQWPKEIQNFRPGSKVQVISSDFSLEERLLKLKAINDGDLEADFVIMSAGTMAVTQETKNAIKELEESFFAATGKRPKADELAELIEDAGLIGDDRLVKEISKMEGAFIYDEAHHTSQGLKGPYNVSHKIAKEVLGEREYTFGMTATPMPKGPEDLFHLMNLFHPGSAGESLASFRNRMVKMKKVPDPDTGKMIEVPVDSDLKDLKVAKESIRPYVFFQRKSMANVTQEMEAKGMKLPELKSISHSLQLEGEVADTYQACGEAGYDKDVIPFNVSKDGKQIGYAEDYITDKQMMEKWEHNPKVQQMIMRLRFFIRKQKAAISPRLLNRDYKGPEPKIDHTVELVSRHFADPKNADRPMVIFGSYRASLALTKEALVKAGMPEHLIGKISGDEDMKERSLAQDAINAGKKKVVLIGIQAGGAGLNLQKKAFRNVFLDKPWTPADMEQAIGRTWRTGSPADEVFIHHMKVAGSIDERKFSKLKSRTQTIDALAFADLDEDFLASTINQSVSNLVGDFDKDVSEWTPEQTKEMLRLAGLPDGDYPPLHSVKAVKENFNPKAFGEQIKHADFKAYGDQRIEELSVMNDLRLKAKAITKKQHERAKRKIAKQTKEWMSAAGVAADHPVSRFAGEDFISSTPGAASVVGAKKGLGKRGATKNATVKRGSVGSKAAKQKAAKVAKLPIPTSKGPAKVHEGSTFKIKRAKTPYGKDTPEWAFFEAMKRRKPTNMREAIRETADWIYQQFKGDPDESYTRTEAKTAAEKWIKKKKILQKFHKDGLMEVLS